MRQILFLICVFLITITSKADVTIPGEVDKQFKIINVDKFPQYQFTFVIQHYKYFQGYQPTGKENKVIINNEIYQCSNHNDNSLITAIDSAGNVFTSTVYVGGKKNFASNVDGYIEVYKIVSVKNKVIALKLIETITRTKKHGTIKEVVKKTGEMRMDNFVTIGLIVSALVSVVGIVLVFKAKENKAN